MWKDGVLIGRGGICGRHLRKLKPQWSRAILIVGVFALLPLSLAAAADATTQPTVFGFQGDQLPQNGQPGSEFSSRGDLRAKKRPQSSDLVSPPAGFFLSLILLPGAGQYYNGSVIPSQHLKGGLFTLTSVAGSFVGAVGALECMSRCSKKANAMMWAGLGTHVTSRVWSAIDALVVGRRINARKYDLDYVNERKKFKYLYRRASAKPTLLLTDTGISDYSQSTVGVELVWRL